MGVVEQTRIEFLIREVISPIGKSTTKEKPLPLIINIIEVRKYIQLCNLIIILSSTLRTGSLIFQTTRNYTFGCSHNTLKRCNINENLLLFKFLS